MALVFGEQKSSFEPAPVGLHPAVCYRLIDQGTQDYPYEGKSKIGRYFTVGWELLIDEKQPNGQPFTVGKRWFFSSHEKARMRLDLEAWRGKKFTNDELKEKSKEKKWNILSIVGAKCMINVTQNERDGETYSNIASIAPTPKGLPMPAGTLDKQVFLMDDDNKEYFNEELLEEFGDKLRERVKSAPEYDCKKKGLPIASLKAKKAAAPLVKEEELNDEIPF